MIPAETTAVSAAPARANRKWRVAAILLLLAVLIPLPWIARRVATELEYFHVRAVQIEGVRYLKPETVLAELALDTMRSVWDDTAPIADRLRAMPQIATVDVSRKLPGTLVVRIGENLPIALATGTNGLEAIDAAGVVLPIDPAVERLDLPIANQRDVPLLALLGAVRAGLPALYRRISEISRDGRTDVIMQVTATAVTGVRPTADSSVGGAGLPRAQATTSLRVRAPLGVSVSRLADIFPVESDLLRRRAVIAELDLRYRDQVIARLQ